MMKSPVFWHLKILLQIYRPNQENIQLLLVIMNMFVMEQFLCLLELTS